MPYSLQTTSDAFGDQVDRAVAQFQQASLLGFRQPDGSYLAVGVRTREQQACLAALRICLAWEDFLEESFLKYLCGAVAPSGYVPTLLTPTLQSMATARQTLSGNNSYLKWDRQSAITRAGSVFDQAEPYAQTFQFVGQTVADLYVVRNRFAHRSEYAATRFRALVLALYGFNPNGMTPGRLLTQMHPDPQVGLPVLEALANRVKAARQLVVPV